MSPKKSENAVYMYIITGGAVLLVSLPLGIMFGCCYSKFCHFQKQRAKQLPTYEEVKVNAETLAAMNMIRNEAYSLPTILHR